MHKFRSVVITIIACLYNSNFVSSQSECGTEAKSDSIMSTLPWFNNNQILDSFTLEGIRRIKRNIPIIPRSNVNYCIEVDEPLFLPITIWWIINEGGEPPREEDIQRLIDKVNYFYQSNGLPFRFFANCPIIWTNPDNTIIESNWQAFWNLHFEASSDKIDVYFVDQLTFAGGVYNGAGDFITVPKSILSGNGHVVLSHEIGHLFGLEHTFRNINHPDGCKREPVSRSRNYSFWNCGPFLWGKMCSTAGDALCDTPADPNYDGLYACPYTETIYDLYGDLFDPDETNIMSYFNRSCRSSLSNGQKGVIMRTLILDHEEFLEFDADHLNADKYEPDGIDLIAREITLGEIQCHSMQDYCRDEVDFLFIENIEFLGSYYFKICDVPNSNNPVDEVIFYNRNFNKAKGSIVNSTRTSGSDYDLYEIKCEDINTFLYGILIEIKRNNNNEGKYTASLERSINPIIDNSGRNCLMVGDQLTITNIPTGTSVFWYSDKNIQFSNNNTSPTIITDLNGQLAPITIKALLGKDGCSEEITMVFDKNFGDPAPNFIINEIEKPCRLYGTSFYEGFYETKPIIDVSWSVTNGSLFPNHGSYTNFIPDNNGQVTLTATFNNGCSLPRSEHKQIYVGDCDERGSKIIINPNPSNGYFYVTLTEPDEAIIGSTIRIIDQYSNIRIETTPTSTISFVDVSGLESGIYYVNWANISFNYSEIIYINQ